MILIICPAGIVHEGRERADCRSQGLKPSALVVAFTARLVVRFQNQSEANGFFAA
jgi:hypothetical protein